MRNAPATVRRILRIAPLALCVLAAWSSPSAAAAAPGLTVQQESLGRAVDAAFSPFVENGAVPGAVVALITDDGVLVRGFGSISAHRPELPNRRTLFGIASVSKVFTGIALADLVREKKIALDDPAEKYLPKGTVLPEKGGRKIRIVHLAGHSSGFGAGGPRDAVSLGWSSPRLWKLLFKRYVWNRNELLGGADWDDLLAVYSAYPLKSVPGEEWEYSNIGMGMLGHILELVDGRSYEEVVKARICAPLGLENTRVEPDPRRETPVMFMRLGPFVGAGGLHSNVNDLVALLSAAMGRKATGLAATLKLSLETHHRTKDGKPRSLGWQRNAEAGTYFHQGGNHAFVGFNAAGRTGVVVLMTGPSEKIAGLGHAALDLVAGRRADFPAPRAVVELPPEKLSRCAGVYEHAEAKPVTVTVEGKSLKARFSNGGSAVLWPESETSFFCKEWDCNFAFKLDGNGEVTGASVKMYNWTGDYVRKEE